MYFYTFLLLSDYHAYILTRMRSWRLVFSRFYIPNTRLAVTISASASLYFVIVPCQSISRLVS